jgi:hypothetical protein
MEWLSILAFLACPLMMLLCMKGMFSSNSKCKTDSSKVTSGVDMKSLQVQMDGLLEQNQKLMREVESLKGKSTNVVDLIEVKREIS